MTPRERFLKLEPGLSLGFETSPELSAVVDVLATNGQARLKSIQNPFGIAAAQGQDLNSIADQDPDAAGKLLDQLMTEVKGAINGAISEGYDGICYLLYGADPDRSTPMQFGGLYLERERELLEAAMAQTFVVLLIQSEREAYFDFVCDLPSHAFGFSEAAGMDVDQMRTIRTGALLADSDRADIRLKPTEGLWTLTTNQAQEYAPLHV